MAMNPLSAMAHDKLSLSPEAQSGRVLYLLDRQRASPTFVQAHKYQA